MMRSFKNIFQAVALSTLPLLYAAGQNTRTTVPSPDNTPDSVQIDMNTYGTAPKKSRDTYHFMDMESIKPEHTGRSFALPIYTTASGKGAYATYGGGSNIGGHWSFLPRSAPATVQLGYSGQTITGLPPTTETTIGNPYDNSPETIGHGNIIGRMAGLNATTPITIQKEWASFLRLNAGYSFDHQKVITAADLTTLFGEQSAPLVTNIGITAIGLNEDHALQLDGSLAKTITNPDDTWRFTPKALVTHTVSDESPYNRITVALDVDRRGLYVSKTFNSLNLGGTLGQSLVNFEETSTIMQLRATHGVNLDKLLELQNDIRIEIGAYLNAQIDKKNIAISGGPLIRFPIGDSPLGLINRNHTVQAATQTATIEKNTGEHLPLPVFKPQ